MHASESLAQAGRHGDTAEAATEHERPLHRPSLNDSACSRRWAENASRTGLCGRAAASAPMTLWQIPESGHVGGHQAPQSSTSSASWGSSTEHCSTEGNDQLRNQRAAQITRNGRVREIERAR